MDIHPLLDIQQDVERLARAVVDEDGATDLTTDLLDPSLHGTARLCCREDVVVAGLAYAEAVARLLACEVEWLARDGEPAQAGTTLGRVTGASGGLLRAERPMLNLLQRACGIATATNRFVRAVEGTACRVLHTRKTAPGLRVFDIAAVLAGGGHLHRVGLDAVVMIKDNHWIAMDARGLELDAAVAEARRRGAASVQVEVESEVQLRAACAAGADRVLIDNVAPTPFRSLADLARQLRPDIEIEATGGITLEAVRRYAEGGADFVSVGALTHSARAADLTLEL